MVTAIVLIKAETNRIPDLAEMIAEMNGVSEVFSVAGRYDLVALVRVTKNEELADVISDKMRHLEGIVETETMIAFRAYSKQELEAGFELGLTDGGIAAGRGPGSSAPGGNQDRVTRDTGDSAVVPVRVRTDGGVFHTAAGSRFALVRLDRSAA